MKTRKIELILYGYGKKIIYELDELDMNIINPSEYERSPILDNLAKDCEIKAKILKVIYKGKTNKKLEKFLKPIKRRSNKRWKW